MRGSDTVGDVGICVRVLFGARFGAEAVSTRCFYEVSLAFASHCKNMRSGVS